MWTKDKFTVKILDINMNLVNKKRLEVHAEIVVSPEFPQCEPGQAHIKRENMEKMNTDLVQATNCLVQLFYQTGQRYSCTKTKVGKLLSIVAFLYARRNQMLFDEAIYKYEGCGTTLKELRFIVDRDIYSRPLYNNDNLCSDHKEDIEASEIDTAIAVPEKFMETDRLSDEIKCTIKEVFIKFGAYNAVDLGHALNFIVQYPQVTNSDGKIDLDVIKRLTLADFSPQETQESFDKKLINFLFADAANENL